MAWRNQLVLVVALGTYVLLGGAVFNTLEYGHHGIHHQREAAILGLTQEFVEGHAGVDPEALQLLVKRAIHVSRSHGGRIKVDPEDDHMVQEPVWDLPNSIFYATTVITTIGYGALCPVTLGGRIFTVMYGMFGIPLFLLTLSGIGARINTATQDLLDKLSTKYHIPRLSNTMRTIFVVCTGSVVFLLLPAAMFSAMEEWTYGEGVYYAFVTLSTIGFGDFVAGMDRGTVYPAWYILARQCWLFLGLAWLSAAIGAKQEVFRAICRQSGQLQLSARKLLHDWRSTKKNGDDQSSSTGDDQEFLHDDDMTEFEYI